MQQMVFYTHIATGQEGNLTWGITPFPHQLIIILS